MKNKLIFFCLLFVFCFSFSLFALTPEEVVKKLDESFSKIKDAQAEIILDTSLQIMGCGGIQRQTGYLWFKAPYKLKVELDKTLYFINGNSIKKIDPQGKRYYVYLRHAPDFSIGFGPKLITHNFLLKVASETDQEIILEGIPKPGLLKNVKKVTFQINKNDFLLHRMNFFLKQNLTGFAQIDYRKIKSQEVPIATQGKSALEIFGGKLVGLYFALSGKKVLINSGLTDRTFEPGF